MPPRGWQWDPTLFLGSASYYARGRLPYPSEIATALANALDLNGRGRMLDVGCGPGTIALLLAGWFAEVVGLDADPDMLAQASQRADELGVRNARWVHALAEDLGSLDLRTFRVATFAASFHWMDRDRVASAVRELLEPDGAFVLVSAATENPPHADEIKALLQSYLGEVRRAGQGVLLHGTPGNELEVLARAGFAEPQIVSVPGGAPLTRSIDDIVAMVHSYSGAAPHLFGDRLDAFQSDLRALLASLSPSGEFVQHVPDATLHVWRRDVADC